MHSDEIEAIVGGYHGDVFRVLGPHLVEAAGSGKAWEVRAFLPQFEQASVHTQTGLTPMEKLHPAGFYAAKFPAHPGHYRIEGQTWAGDDTQIEDPYRYPMLVSEFDLHLFGEGTLYAAYDTFGAHLAEVDGQQGTRFVVWAPNALIVSVVGQFNEWDPRRNPMRQRNNGVWELFLPNVGEGTPYKYLVKSRFRGHEQQKADPYGFLMEVPPKSASVVWDIDKYEWNDADWLARRGRTDWLRQPLSVYELHLESWMRDPRGHGLSYRELAESLVQYVREMGYTHIELMPPMEHPFSGSWGYQVTGFFAPTSRFGTPEDFMYLVDKCHQADIGVIIDWVPGHFPKDAHGLAYFDGTALYEHEDPRRGEHRDWGTLIFNYGRNEVKTFLISNALFWLKKYHIDGLRVDAVASILYLDYSRKEGEWVPNMYGGNEDLEAIDFLRKFNELAHQEPGAITIAEESTAFSGVSRPVYLGGLGFTMKWNMGWMHDMLLYFSKDPVHRKYHHNSITFSMLYAFTENFLLPISHDEVTHGKGSLIRKMPGDEWQRFANARAFLAYMYGHPGKKLTFMGSEVGQYEEWNANAAVGWDLLQFTPHNRLQAFVRELNHFYRSQPALYERDFHWSGFEWIDFNDWEHSVICFLRHGENPSDDLLFVCNFTPVVYEEYRVGAPTEGWWAEVFNTDNLSFGGSGVLNGGTHTERHTWQGRSFSLRLRVPPLGVAIFQRQG